MDTVIRDYSEAVKNYVELSQKETKIQVQVKQARARLQKAKELMRSQEEELLETKLN